MYKRFLFLIIFIFSLGLNSSVFAIDVAFIDMDVIMSKSKVGSSIINQLKALNKTNIKNFKIKEKNFIEKEKKLLVQKNLLTEAEYKKKFNDLRVEINNYNLDKKKLNNILNKKKNENRNDLLNLINPIIINYSKQKSISLILQKKNLILGKKELDITNEIMKLINQQIKEKKI